MTEEPLYEYIRGQGWIVSTQNNEILDIRTDKTKPGKWRLQIWLVGLTVPGGNYKYTYMDWVDLQYGYLYPSLDEVNAIIREYPKRDDFSKTLIEIGMKFRVVNCDDDGGWRILHHG